MPSDIVNPEPFLDFLSRLGIGWGQMLVLEFANCQIAQESVHVTISQCGGHGPTPVIRRGEIAAMGAVPRISVPARQQEPYVINAEEVLELAVPLHQAGRTPVTAALHGHKWLFAHRLHDGLVEGFVGFRKRIL